VADNRYSNELPGRRRAGRERSFADGEPPILDVGEAGRGFARLASVWTRTTAHAVFDTVAVVNQLAADVTDTLIDGLSPVQARPGASGPASAGTRGRRVPMVNQVSNSVTWAMQDAADVVARSAEQLNRVFQNSEKATPGESTAAAGAGTTNTASPAGG
jgi:hypothetical protein